jgi:uncharacterized protein YbjT (DUF2867 family)
MKGTIMTTYLVTGATGRIGNPTTAQLRAHGHEVRALSRRAGDGVIAGDLMTGAGIRESMAGVDTVIHLATTNGADDIQIARNLVAAATDACIKHLVLLSIVGIDKIPFGFYRQRLEIEDIAARSSVPLTLQRATQFHPFVEEMFTAQRFSPVLMAPSIRFQPIATAEVAARLVDLAAGDPMGRVDDIGGPKQQPARELLAEWKRATGRRRPDLPVRLPGKTFKAFAEGENLVPGATFGQETFAEYLAVKYS